MAQIVPTVAEGTAGLENMADHDAEVNSEPREPMHLRQCFALACLALEVVRDSHLVDYSTAQAALETLRRLRDQERKKEGVDTEY